MTPERVFQTLLFLGLLAGGWLYGDYWKKSAAQRFENQEADTLRAENIELTQKVEELQGELAQVRSMLASGPYPIPDDLIAWIEKDYGMVFLKTPDVRLAPPSVIQETAEKNLKLIHGELGLEKENTAWELMGLLPPNQRLLTQLIAVNSADAKGIFDLTKGQVLLSESFDPVSVPDRSVLARLLAMQLSFQNHPQKEWKTRDEWQAWEAVHTGSAAAAQARFLRRNAAANEAEWTDPEPGREQLLIDLAPVLGGMCNFPFLEGAEYSRYYYIDSREAWNRMFRNPAKTTSEIIHPGRKPIDTGEVSFPDPPNSLLNNCIGELGLRLWLEPYAGVLEAGPLSEEWRGDRYHLKQTGQEVELIWHIEMATEKAARSLAAEVERSMLASFQEFQWNRNITINQEGTRVTFQNQPKAP